MLNYFWAFNWGELFKASMVLFAVIDVIGSVPLIIKIKEQSGDIHPARTSFVSLGIMIGFLILGESILKLFGVDVGSFAVAGSLILFAMSLEMILGVRLFRDSVSGKTASVVPLAFPIIAGAGTMTTLVSLRAEFQNINIVVAILINVLIVYIVLRLTKRIENLLGPGGIAIMKKVFGIILLAIAVKLFTTNIAKIILNVEAEKHVQKIENPR
ncbi:MAG: multiple antibiotic resistance (MarC)-related protein [Fluviicola sp.]|jgi:multiple antibiotic resistance protein|uniref:MarC family protein n=1 Tax=Fluviicola sp. TaxID=1917219 RepID=UPI00260DC4F8|nr:MarC family protein [Fluviicola sp.]MDF3027930.1 multiple antibiotic resistance (MarC)-related protein [Fluviicola sp.]